MKESKKTQLEVAWGLCLASPVTAVLCWWAGTGLMQERLANLTCVLAGAGVFILIRARLDRI